MRSARGGFCTPHCNSMLWPLVPTLHGTNLKARINLFALETSPKTAKFALLSPISFGFMNPAQVVQNFATGMYWLRPAELG